MKCHVHTPSYIKRNIDKTPYPCLHIQINYRNLWENDHGGHRNLFFSKINPWQPLGPLLKVRLLVELNSKELCGNKANLHPFRGRPNTGDRNRSHRVVQQPLNLWLRCSQEKLKCFLMGLLTSHTSQQNVASTLW